MQNFYSELVSTDVRVTVAVVFVKQTTVQFTQVPNLGMHSRRFSGVSGLSVSQIFGVKSAAEIAADSIPKACASAASQSPTGVISISVAYP